MITYYIEFSDYVLPVEVKTFTTREQVNTPHLVLHRGSGGVPIEIMFKANKVIEYNHQTQKAALLKCRETGKVSDCKWDDEDMVLFKLSATELSIPSQLRKKGRHLHKNVYNSRQSSKTSS